MRPLHVGLNLVYLEPDSGGTGTYARELIRALARVEPETRITAWVGAQAPRDLDPAAEWVRLPVRGTRSPLHVPVELLGLGLDARRRGIDVVHGLAYATPLVAPGVATAVTILDLTWRHAPATATRRMRLMFGALSAACGRSADRVIAISEAARNDLIQTLGLDPAKIVVTPLGVSPEPVAAPVPEDELRTRLGLGDAPVVLSVGQVSEHKNLLALVEALQLLADQRTRIVIAGRRTPYAERLVRRATELGVRDRLVIAGFVDDATLEGLYGIAAIVALPTLQEGFGLPLLEAMRRGVPVACSELPVLREVAGEAVAYFDPHDPAQIAAAINAPPDPDAGRRRAARFTWDRTARETLAVYRAALGSRASWSER